MKRLILVILFFLAGCSPVIVTRYSKTYPATDSVEVFRTVRPERPYVEIAELEVQSGKKAVQRLTKKARKIGADAIIIMGERTTTMILDYPFSFEPYYLGTTGVGQLKTLWAIAIRYTDTGGRPGG